MIYAGLTFCYFFSLITIYLPWGHGQHGGRSGRIDRSSVLGPCKTSCTRSLRPSAREASLDQPSGLFGALRHDPRTTEISTPRPQGRAPAPNPGESTLPVRGGRPSGCCMSPGGGAAAGLNRGPRDVALSLGPETQVRTHWEVAVPEVLWQLGCGHWTQQARPYGPRRCADMLSGVRRLGLQDFALSNPGARGPSNKCSVRRRTISEAGGKLQLRGTQAFRGTGGRNRAVPLVDKEQPNNR
ncbi:hypothetical protein NDU88_002440 [Pleurodeles waltl]|uniref:Uncharacterized protein n=1 Tax=Pleurodeles waltl TaxID=8319 RepID=A0AAV7LE66_PLEWA|nr:hypothetical protein NDU88_002440 [Pleurodeles waltl]